MAYKGFEKDLSCTLRFCATEGRMRFPAGTIPALGNGFKKEKS